MDVQAVHSQQAASRCGGHGEFSCEETRCISVKFVVMFVPAYFFLASQYCTPGFQERDSRTHSG